MANFQRASEPSHERERVPRFSHGPSITVGARCKDSGRCGGDVHGAKSGSSSTDRTYIQEIRGQPEDLLGVVRFYRREGRELLRKWRSIASAAQRITFAGMGTSDFAGETAVVMMAARGLDAAAVEAGELLHYPRRITGVLALVSQSGESIETSKLARAYAGACRLVAVTNNPSSSLARRCELVLPMRAGDEGIIPTKTYSNSLALLHLMARAIESGKALTEALDVLERIAAVMAAPPVPADFRAAARVLRGASALSCVSRGPAMTLAKHAAQSFLEGAGIYTAAYTGSAFRHGPIETLGPGDHCLFLIPKGATSRLLADMAREAVERKARVVVITDQRVVMPAGKSAVLEVPSFGEELFALAACVALERLLVATAADLGLRVERTAPGEKISTRE